MNKNPKYWFKRRRYGYGWIPVRWQGWAVLAGYLLAVVGAASAFSDPDGDEMWLFLLVMLLATVGLISISFAKGPRPRWRWGARPTDNPDEDF